MLLVCPFWNNRKDTGTVHVPPTPPSFFISLAKKCFVDIVNLCPQTFILNYKAVLEFQEEKKYPVTFKLIICQVYIQ